MIEIKKIVPFLVVLAVIAVAFVAVPSVAKVGLRATPIPFPDNLFGMTVLAFLVWLVAPTGLWGWVLGYFFAHVPFADPWPQVITAILVAALAAAVQAGSAFVPPDILNQTIGAAIIMLIQALFGLATQTIGVVYFRPKLAMQAEIFKALPPPK